MRNLVNYLVNNNKISCSNKLLENILSRLRHVFNLQRYSQCPPERYNFFILLVITHLHCALGDQVLHLGMSDSNFFQHPLELNRFVPQNKLVHNHLALLRHLRLMSPERPSTTGGQRRHRGSACVDNEVYSHSMSCDICHQP